MFKKLTILILIFQVASQLMSQDAKWPEHLLYEEVVNHFFEVYSPEGSSEIEFQKKPDGYWIRFVDYGEIEKAGEPLLFWNLEKKEYQKLNLLPASSGKAKNNVIQNALQQQGQFGRHPYFGYVGWYDDVIKNYEGKKLPTPELINGLARAYSAKANCMISSQTGYTEKKFPFDKTFDPADVPDYDVGDYITFMHKAIDTWKELMDQFPEFEVIVGSPVYKHSNEYMTAWMDLEMIGWSVESAAFLKKGLYNPLMIEIAKNYLNSCPKNAILFTNGDNDTYPLHYVQEAENFRKDVLILNVSMLNLPRYIHWQVLRGMPLNISPDVYREGSNPYLLLDENAKIVGAEKLLTVLQNNKAENEAAKMEASGFSIKVNQVNVKKNIPDAENLVDEVQIINSKKRYIYKGDFVMTDCIAANAWNRPICFSSTVSPSYFQGLDKWLFVTGLVNTLIPEKNNTSSSTRLDLKNTIEFLLETMETDAMVSASADELENDAFFLNIRNVFLNVMRDKEVNSYGGKRKELLDLYGKLFVNTKVKRIPQEISVVWFAMNASDEKGAGEFLKLILEEAKQSCKSPASSECKTFSNVFREYPETYLDAFNKLGLQNLIPEFNRIKEIH